MSDNTPRIEPSAAPADGVARLAGLWTAPQLAAPGMLQKLRSALPRAAAWDLRDAEQLDHVGAQLLWDHWGRQWPGQVEATPGQRAVLDRVARFTVQPPPRQRRTLLSYYLGLG